MVAKGMSYKQIAERLVLSHRTVQNHVQNTLRKLQMHNRVELTRYAIEQGLDEDEDGERVPPRDATAAYLAAWGDADRPPTYDTAGRAAPARTWTRCPTRTSRSCSAGRRRSTPATSLARVGARRPGRLLLPPERRARDRARRAGLRA